jgi:pyrimidine-nucleoside phosphorylase
MLLLAGKADTLAAARALADSTRASGSGLASFRAMVAAQGGDVAQVDDPSLLPQAPYIEPVLAPHGGVVASMNTEALGWTAVHLGGGRLLKSDQIDYAVGFELPIKIGDRVEAGQPIATIHANDLAKLAEARTDILTAISWSETAVDPLPHFYDVVGM